MPISQAQFDARFPQGILNHFINNTNAKPASWAASAWTEAVKAGVDDKSPQGLISREQMVALLVKLNLLPFAPGTGAISSKGINLLKQYEYMGKEYMVCENGVLVAILSRDVEGKGNITYGYGTLFYNNDADKKRLRDVYGLSFGLKVRTPIATCEKMMHDYFATRYAGLHNFTKDNDMWIKQNHFDALTMHRYLRGTLGSDTQAMLKTMFANSKNKHTKAATLKSNFSTKLYDAMLADLKKLGNWSTYGNGWTSRLKDEMELFFDGDDKRNY